MIIIIVLYGFGGASMAKVIKLYRAVAVATS